LSKDKENVPLPFLGSNALSTAEGVQPFTPDQMVACQLCSRSNPPTRVNCLYCGTGLPVTNAVVDLQKPELRRLENWEQGYNNILNSSKATAALNLNQQAITEAADLLKLEAAGLSRMISANHALPLARSSSRDEATLIQRRLKSFGIDTVVIADVNLAGSAGPFRVRALEIHDAGLKVYERQHSRPLDLSWAEILLLVFGRLTVQRLESREEKASRKEMRVLDSSEFFTDETIFDFYAASARPFRILAKSFDFSCLGPKKRLLAEENMSTLLTLFREKASSAAWDDSYNSVRKALEAVWPSERSDRSGGWRRDRPGKLTKGNVTEISNKAQFQKYSRLCHYLASTAPGKPDEES
jgi:hypothetical protein